MSKKNSRPVVTIYQVPHKRQRYETVGDWIPGRPPEIRVSRMRDKRHVFLVALHEMIEYELCKKNGITDEEVVVFDINFENEKARNLRPIDAEPGDDPSAPYRKEHQFATMIERMVARKLGVDWSDYGKAVLELAPKRHPVAAQPLVRSR